MWGDHLPPDKGFGGQCPPYTIFQKLFRISVIGSQILLTKYKFFWRKLWQVLFFLN